MPKLELNASPTSVTRDMSLRLLIKHALVSQIISYSLDIVDQSTKFTLQLYNMYSIAPNTRDLLLRGRLEANVTNGVLLVLNAALY